jgi:hypothetical protein
MSPKTNPQAFFIRPDQPAPAQAVDVSHRTNALAAAREFKGDIEGGSRS